MGHPPKRVLYQKLVGRYFKRTGEIRLEESAALRNQLYTCWERFGVDHVKCHHLVPGFDKAWAMQMSA